MDTAVDIREKDVVKTHVFYVEGVKVAFIPVSALQGEMPGYSKKVVLQRKQFGEGYTFAARDWMRKGCRVSKEAAMYYIKKHEDKLFG